jgi:hypothetical protein
MKKWFKYWWQGLNLFLVGAVPWWFLSFEEGSESRFLVHGIRPWWLRCASGAIYLVMVIITPILLRIIAGEIRDTTKAESA